MRVSFKNISLVLICALMLLFTIAGAMATEFDSGIKVKQVFVDESKSFNFEFEVSSSVMVSFYTCDFFIDDEKVVSNVISSPSRPNVVRESLDLAPGTYDFYITCEADGVVFSSKTHSLVVRDLESTSSYDAVPNTQANNESSNDILFIIVVVLALILLIKNMFPSINRKRNKRLRRLS